MRKAVKITIITFGIVLLLPIVLFTVGLGLYCRGDYLEPEVTIDECRYVMETRGDSVRMCGKNTLVLNRHGLWEVKLYGNPIERGTAYGVMCQDLMQYQEQVFVDQIHEMIPSEFWIEFLHKLVCVFNRNLASYIPEEYRQEIYAMSQFASNEYNAYGTPYMRQLNYHAAHDIGHTLQEYMLVGCSSFATWNEMSEDSLLTIGRNFDFHVGDAFAENKMLLFVEPQQGHRFASVTWPGMMGVLSGMNERGLTVTINAARGSIPTSSAMPISLLTREILQYASDIDEAYEIAQRHKTFVSESILIGSARDNRAAIIEKTPDRMALYDAGASSLVCTNHYQSELLKEDEHNVENIRDSDSPYRYQRLGELIGQHTPVSPCDAVAILRNRHGVGGADIGLTNEKSVNQFICHHSVVFQPSELKMWVSTSPWQLGEFICYDLDSVFASTADSAKSATLEELVIPADSNALAVDYYKVVQYKAQNRAIRNAINNSAVLPDTFLTNFIGNNPNLFQAYNLVGDYMQSIGNREQALAMWRTALTKEIARKSERKDIERKVKDAL